jgi:hypothetical protein
VEEKSIQDLRDEIEAQVARIGEPLFTSKSFPDPDWYLNAVLHISPDKWDAYAEGYKKAADIIVQYIINNNRDQDYLIFPVVFLYRHYLELRLKELIVVSSRLLDHDVSVPTHHDLVSLWKQVRPNLEQVWPEQEKHVLDKVEERLKELSEADLRSFGFRYPIDTKGQPTLVKLKHINLKHLRDVIQGISNILDGSSIGMGEYLDAKNEMMAEYRADMANEYNEEY